MSEFSVKGIKCDFCGNKYQAIDEKQTMQNVRFGAVMKGWIRNNEMDYCNECSAKFKRAVNTENHKELEF